ncbi:DUF1801 domain-containing protein [Patescibacteria group bacterium]
MTVDIYIDKQKSLNKKILKRLRKLIKKTVPGITEEIKMGVPWYEGKYYLVSLKDHVNMGFAFNKMLEKYKDTLEGKGKYMRHIKFFSEEDIKEKELVALIKATKKGYVNPHPKK